MMDLSSVGLPVLKSLASQTGKMVPKAKQLYAEHRAKAGKVQGETRLLRDKVSEVINRIIIDPQGTPWWKSASIAFCHLVFPPAEIFKVIAVKEWLSEKTVQDLFCEVVSSILTGSSGDSSSLKRDLSKKYSNHTGEREEYASYAIDIMINTIIASIFSPLGSDLEAQTIATFIQEDGYQTRQEVLKSRGEVIDAFSREISALNKNRDAAHDLGKIKSKEYADALESLLVRRRLKDPEILREISVLAKDVNGDYSAFIDPSLKTKILFYAALWHCDKDATLQKVDEYLAQLRDLNPGEDIRRIEAARLHRQGETEKAIKIVDQIKTPEAKAQLFGYLYLQKGPKVALEWIGSDLFSLDLMSDWGWENVALAMVEIGRWHDALDLLVRYQSRNREIAAGIAFLEGMLHIALTFAEEYRLKVIRGDIFPAKAGIIDGPEVPAHRQRALECFDMIERLAQQYKVKPRERGAQFWKAWLLLTDKTTEKDGIEFVQYRLESTDPDPGLLDLAVRFKVDFDSNLVQESLRRRELTGTLDADDLFIKLTLLQHQKATKKIIDFLKREKTWLINSVLSRSVWAGLLIENLISEDEVAQAEEVLEEERTSLEDDAERFEIILAAKKGADVSNQVIEKYCTSGNLIDLINLCRHLEQRGDYATLKGYAQKAFELQYSVDNAFRIARCMMNLHGYEEVVSFLDAHPEILSKNRELQSMKAWALFYLGQFGKARPIADDLFREEPNERIVELRINIAFFSGCWKKVRGIVEHELRGSERHPAPFILLMATMVSNDDRDLSMVLIEKAVNASPEDISVLCSAGLLAIQIGKEEIGFLWIGKARALSGPEGPFKIQQFNQIKNFLVEARERLEARQKLLKQGKIPWHLFCDHSNMPLCRPLVALVLDNEEEKDVRRKPLLPVRHGVREDLDLTKVQHIAMDMTALLISEVFNLFPNILETFRSIHIPWETMNILFEEQRSARFYQPTRILRAKNLLEIISKRSISVISNVPTTPIWLIREVGRENAELLQSAKEANGCFITVPPIYRVGSFLMEGADLREYAAVVATPKQVVMAMYDQGCLSEVEMEEGLQKLHLVEIDEKMNSRPVAQGPFYISPLAMEKLDAARVLSKAASFRECFIHKATHLELLDLKELEWQEDSIISILEGLRKRLRDGIKSGKIVCQPRVDGPDEHIGEFMGILSLLKGFSPAEAVWVEDRMIGKNPRTKDSSGHEALIVGTFDVAKELARRGILKAHQRYHLHYRMRQANLIVIPSEADEVDHWLSSAKIDPDKGIIAECAELRAIRQNHRKLISSDYLQLPEEKTYLVQIQQTVVDLLGKYWNEDPLDVSIARARSDWLLDSLYTSVLDTRHLFPIGKEPKSWKDSLKLELIRLMALNLENTMQRQEYFKWLDERLLKPLDLSNLDVQRDLAEFIKNSVRKVYDETIEY